MSVPVPIPVPAPVRSRLLYVPFGLLNATIAGLLGIALPVLAGRPALAGAAGAVLSLGLAIGAPLAGWLSTRVSATCVLAASLFATGLAFLAFAVPQPCVFLGATFAVGLGASVGLTLATLFVMGWYPKGRWDAQIGWLQTWMGAGQVLGLVAASVILERLGLVLLGAGLLLIAAAWAVWLPPPSTRGTTRRPRHQVRQPARTEGVGVMDTHHLAAFHPREWPILRHRPLLSFLVPWSVAQLGTAPLFAFYPLLMAGRFGVPQREAAALFALATLVGTGLYEPAGALTKRYGATVVLLMSYIVRGLALATVAIAILLHASVLWAGGGFVVIVVTWSFLAVAGNARIAALAPPGAAGAALGAVAAAATLARAAGNLAAGAVVAHVGYGWIVAVSAALLGAAAAWAACGPRGSDSR